VFLKGVVVRVIVNRDIMVVRVVVVGEFFDEVPGQHVGGDAVDDAGGVEVSFP
jgi:hypothetical protein